MDRLNHKVSGYADWPRLEYEQALLPPAHEAQQVSFSLEELATISAHGCEMIRADTTTVQKEAIRATKASIQLRIESALE